MNVFFMNTIFDYIMRDKGIQLNVIIILYNK